MTSLDSFSPAKASTAESHRRMPITGSKRVPNSVPIQPPIKAAGAQ